MWPAAAARKRRNRTTLTSRSPDSEKTENKQKTAPERPDKTTPFQEAMFLPTTVKEVRERGWDQLDVILFSGDAYIDHPAFGAAVVGRLLEAEGYRVAIVPQPNWRDDLRDFTKLGAPKLFFGVSAGAMDSMVNHYTANLRLRQDRKSVV